MSATSPIRPALLGKMNERQVLRVIQAGGALSRAEVARRSGISPPTASKAVASLLRAGLLEEVAAEEAGRGRPARKLRLARHPAQILGLAIDARDCRMVATGLDGVPQENKQIRFATPGTYEALVDAVIEHARTLTAGEDGRTLMMGISIPGLVDYRAQRSLLSPNVSITNDHSPAADLGAALGVDCVMLQEMHSLCLAERHYGLAAELDDFAMLDISTGVGLGVFSGGQLVTGHSGLAGELGHIVVDIDGRPCGCGGHGCLETLASDSAFTRSISEQLGREVMFEECLELIGSGQLDASAAIDRTCRYLAVAVAAVINLFNPSTLLIHGRFFEVAPGLFDRVIREAGQRALSPSFSQCRIVQARGSKIQGAVAAAIEHLTSSLVPTGLETPTVPRPQES